MLPCSSGSADAGADKDSGTCSSVSLFLRSAAHQTARPATSIATLRCETVPGGAAHRLLQADALPASRREENNARPSTFESPSVPGNPCHNIIPSVLRSTGIPRAGRRVGSMPKVVCRSKSSAFPTSTCCISTVMSFLKSIGVSDYFTGPEGFKKVGHVVEVNISGASCQRVT